MPTCTFAVRLLQKHVRTLSVCCAALGLAAIAQARLVQHAPTQPTTVEAMAGSDEDDPLKIFRAPLLREGSALVEAAGTLQRDADDHWWTLTVQPDNSSGPPYELVMLPCTRLAEMERILETMGSNVTFQVTGRVYVFRGENYVLPSHAAVVNTSSRSFARETTRDTATQAPPATALDDATTTSAGATGTTQPADQATRDAGRDSAESILSELEQQAGPIARSSGSANAARGARNGLPASQGDSGPAAATAPATPNLQENTAIVNRRGRITRDRSGGWLLVFDADASGLADPPLKLLPCMLLESIEDYARRVGNNSPIVITGQVYLYNGQNYLLPTVYRIPRESSRLTP